MTPAAPVTDRVRGRRPSSARRRWQAVVGVIAVLCVLPIALVVVSMLTPSREIWSFLIDAGLAGMIWTTLALVTTVIAGSVALGAGFAWLIGRYRFPGDTVFSWLLVLPLAVPAYVSGFVYIGLLDHPGIGQQGLRAVFGDDVWFPDVRSFWLCALVLIFGYYPYAYILARAAIAGQSLSTYQAARALGAGPLTAAFRVVLPLARPSLAAAGMVIAMETLTDFATVQYFGVTTVSVGVHQVWVGMYNREAATELAGVVMLFALGVLVMERVLRGGARFHQQPGSGTLARVQLPARRGWGATAACMLLLTVTVGIPVAQLVAWAVSGGAAGVNARFGSYVLDSAAISGGVAVLCTVVGLVLASASRLGGGKATPWLGRAAAIGYAVPGPVVAIGVLAILAGVQQAISAAGFGVGGALVTGTVFGLVYAYVVRFLALAWSSLDAGLERVSQSLTSAALALGVKPSTVMSRVHAPLLRPSVGVALVLVAVDTLKELPIMLLLRPFGFETLAVWVYQLASESRWQSAGLPALTIVAIATVPILLVFRRTLGVTRDE